MTRTDGYDLFCSTTGEVMSLATPNGADMHLSRDELEQKIIEVFGPTVSSEPSPPPTIEEIVDGQSLTGAALAEALGLTLEPKPGAFGPCQAWFGAGEQGGYCVDGLSPYKDHLFVIGQALRGVDLNDEQLQTIEKILHRNADEGDQFALDAP